MYFRWVQDEPSGIIFDKERHVGLIAQEVQEVLPEAVTSLHSGKYLGVDYGSVVPLIVEAVHELHEGFNGAEQVRRQRSLLRSRLLERLQRRLETAHSRVDLVQGRFDAVAQVLAQIRLSAGK
ncbi:hypothetical protein B484DRAFT_407504 [Ochromonadaceae sp. CCMP2298]|nr:hypothetical protein B484DRAFT_407504 [Ochromonadaceae sp. CCMP2298]